MKALNYIKGLLGAILIANTVVILIILLYYILFYSVNEISAIKKNHKLIWLFISSKDKNFVLFLSVCLLAGVYLVSSIKPIGKK